jgi:hypothetical protein
MEHPYGQAGGTTANPAKADYAEETLQPGVAFIRQPPVQVLELEDDTS